MIVLLATACGACATPTPAPSQTVKADRHGMCAARMYAARQPRSAVNWGLYDYCMRSVD
ncbi:MAG TPA: hypothetical protein VKF40_21345 [Burkholderiales bacterium]|nr:hypothetical protein [Burkholderiales bacterium]